MRLLESENDDDIDVIKYHFYFNEAVIHQAQMKIPIEYETNLNLLLTTVDAEPPINFDDLVPYDPVDILDYEVEKYQKIALPSISYFEDHEEKIYRPGCEYESILR